MIALIKEIFIIFQMIIELFFEMIYKISKILIIVIPIIITLIDKNHIHYSLYSWVLIFAALINVTFCEIKDLKKEKEKYYFLDNILYMQKSIFLLDDKVSLLLNKHNSEIKDCKIETISMLNDYKKVLENTYLILLCLNDVKNSNTNIGIEKEIEMCKTAIQNTLQKIKNIEYQNNG